MWKRLGHLLKGIESVPIDGMRVGRCQRISAILKSKTPAILTNVCPLWARTTRTTDLGLRPGSAGFERSNPRIMVF